MLGRFACFANPTLSSSSPSLLSPYPSLLSKDSVPALYFCPDVLGLASSSEEDDDEDDDEEEA